MAVEQGPQLRFLKNVQDGGREVHHFSNGSGDYWSPKFPAKTRGPFLAMRSTALTFLVDLKSDVVSSDPDPLQDFCIGDLNIVPGINGFPCTNSSTVTVDDFIYSGIVNSSNTTNINRSGAIFGTVLRFPGLNTLGLSIARLDFLPEGIIPPHTHPRASEMVYVEEGTVYAAIVTADNRLFARVMNRGEVMVIPRGLIHWQMNVGRTNAKIIATLNSQLPGIQFIARSMFGSRPEVPDEVLEKTFFLDERSIDQVRSNFV
ncbi:germin-like protein subfamily T member 2 [Selaginella moellendorffii]|uniref:germin-like protein subfamily T member 2 n=1 Tax=Selaginella moellendorffii TaxID=88036 RepID=UPI000D1C6E2B|nr:germin-like protein subfamily T member 2 [Selaginella moellendorffii]|eukprot:XP_002978995.2 germin-like protein subfamily T member 2 [Selaginella moellendorffii]